MTLVTEGPRRTAAAQHTPLTEFQQEYLSKAGNSIGIALRAAVQDLIDHKKIASSRRAAALRAFWLAIGEGLEGDAPLHSVGE